MFLFLSLLSAHSCSLTDNQATATDALDSVCPSGEPGWTGEPSPGPPKGRTAGLVLSGVVTAVMIAVIIVLVRKKQPSDAKPTAPLDQSLTAELPISEQF
jgi:hypothetical protein